jgi:hypothetical protein
MAGADDRRGRGRLLGMTSLAGVLAVVGAVIALRLDGDYLHVEWGRGGDATFYRLLTSTMIRHGWVTYNPDIGYPYAMDIARFPMPEYRSWWALKVITWFTDDPSLALNLLFLFGFFLVGAASYLLFIATSRLEWLSLVLAVSAATLPWHFHRFTHVLIADYSPAPLALLLAFLMWTGWWTRSNRRLAIATAAAAYIGLGGLYYAAFSVIVLAPVTVWRIAKGRRVNQWWRDAVILATIPVTLGIAVAAFASSSKGPGTAPTYVRDPDESLAFAGVLKSLVEPWPLSAGQPFWEGWAFLNLVAAVAVVAAVVLALILAIPRVARDSPSWHGLGAEITPWLRMMVWVLVWCAPGLGYLFATTVWPVVRSWGRLTVFIAYIAMVVLGIALKWFIRRRPRAMPAVVVGLCLAVAWQVGQDHRVLLTPTAESLEAEARPYVAEVRSTLAPGCPILQLPMMRNPEDWSLNKDLGMPAYDHMVMPIVAPEYRWSFGVVTGSSQWDQAEARYFGDVSMSDLIERAREDGFCAIHADLVGLDAQQRAELTAELGQPLVSHGRWRLFTMEQ